MLNAGAGGVAQQLEHAGAAQHAVLRKRDDLHRECAVVVRGRLANRLDAAQPESEVDVDVRAHRGRAVRDELLEHVAGDLRRWHPDLVAPGTLVPDVPLGAALAAVGLPRQPPPRLVDVRVGVHEARQCQQAAPVHARVYAGIRGTDAGDAAVLQSQVDGGVAPGADVAEQGRGRKGHHPCLAPCGTAGRPEHRIARDNLTEVHGPVAQLVARLVRIEEVRGSNPLRSTEETPAARAGGFMFGGRTSHRFP